MQEKNPLKAVFKSGDPDLQHKVGEQREKMSIQLAMSPGLVNFTHIVNGAEYNCMIIFDRERRQAGCNDT